MKVTASGTPKATVPLTVDADKPKTIVLEDEKAKPLVALMHGDASVSTKNLARHLGVKLVRPCDPTVAERHTGYKVGGTSPFGLKRPLPIFAPESVLALPALYINGGARGFLVAITDYQGIGLDEAYHPYLDSTTEGFNLIDLARATRKLVPAASTNWIAVGTGQGGQAAWAAAELATDYGGGLRPQGAVALAPIAALEWLADASAAGNLNRDQQLMLQQYLVAMTQAYPGFPLEDYRRGAARDNWATLAACRGPAVADRTVVLDSLGPHDLGPTTPEATERLDVQVLLVELDQLLLPLLHAGELIPELGHEVVSHILR